MRLDLWLSSRFNYNSRSKWQELIRNKDVLLNNKSARPSRIVAENDIVELKTNVEKEPDSNTNYTVIFEDENIIALNKPPDLPCHPSGAYFHKTLWYLVVNDLKIKAHIVHRLDRETSGIIVMAKNPAIAKELSELFVKKQIHKTYVAAVHGSFPERHHSMGYLEHFTGSVLLKKRRFVALNENKFKSFSGNEETSETYFELIKEHRGLSLVKAIPKTGRFHQIRATLYSLGFPVVGDKYYGLDETIFLRFISDSMTQEDKKILILDRQALHAKTLDFTLPSTGKPYLFDTEIPLEITSLFND
ncbi:MAG: hypothetical protein A2X47_12290 [Lentisphaerae bacterium GWF2_38_69]|nr:MAG: hypothetical protein A2X47_12290 [Lentisphaerae bacterium GWF2_38_69]